MTRENIKEHNPNCPQIPDHPLWILIIGGNGSGKTNALFNLTSHHQIIKFTYISRVHMKQDINC